MVPLTLAGSLAQRGNQPVGDYCPMARTLTVISTRSSVLLLREAYYGATRFDEFVQRSALTETTTASTLRDLVDAGILTKRPYQDPGQRRRSEYVLTSRGRDLMPVLLALLQWGNRHETPPYPPVLSHTGCDQPVTIVAECASGHQLGLDELTITAAGPFGLLAEPDVSDEERGGAGGGDHRGHHGPEHPRSVAHHRHDQKGHR